MAMENTSTIRWIGGRVTVSSMSSPGSNAQPGCWDTKTRDPAVQALDIWISRSLAGEWFEIGQVGVEEYREFETYPPVMTNIAMEITNF